MRRVAAWAALAEVALLYWASEQPQVAVAPYLPFDFADKVVHAAAYGLLAGLLLAALGGADQPRAKGAAVVLTIVLGLFDEWHQSWHPERHRFAAWDDAAADAVGALVVVFTAGRLARRRPRSSA
jgi:VanZ family protein